MTFISRIATILLLLGFVNANAQNATGANVEMATGFTSSGKIYVVIAVVVIILVGLLLYIVSIDRKLRKLEKESKTEKK